MDAVRNALGSLETERGKLASQLNEVLTAINALKPLVQKEVVQPEPVVVVQEETSTKRWGSWTNEDDKALAEACNMCMSDPNMSQGDMLKFASDILHRTPAACGYRWYRKIKPRLSEFLPELNPTA